MPFAFCLLPFAIAKTHFKCVLAYHYPCYLSPLPTLFPRFPIPDSRFPIPDARCVAL
ncbi:hypothetical protein [Moorena producens]|uniref:hypothetical protein n=1 Tax=Moorena producens TaxID=1155739 RepID=UPI000AF29DCD|nr:hypothetical protein [Moorena producens]